MRLKIDPQWHILAIVAAGLVIGLRAGTILEHRVWGEGKDVVTGRIEDIQASRQVRVIRYTYEVDGKTYRAEETDKTRFIEGVPVRVTFARKDPSVSTLIPESIESRYRISLIVCGVALLPLLTMWGIELKALFGRK